MAKNTKKVSINVIEKVLKEEFAPQSLTSANWRGIDVEIKNTLSLVDMVSFVEDVVDSCFYEDRGFMPELLDFAIRNGLITRYTNISIPSNLEKRYEILYETDIVDFVERYVDERQYKEIQIAIRRKVDFISATEVSGIHRQLTQVVSLFEDVQKNAEGVFKDLSGDDLSKLIKAVAGNKLDEKKLVDAVIDRKEASGA